MSVTIAISDEATAVFRDAKDFAARLLKRVAVVMDSQNELTAGHIVARRMSQRGPDTLGVVTGRLRRSVRPAKARVFGNVIWSAIGSNVRYAGAHEFGFQGTVTVRAHTRRFARFEGQAISLKDAKTLQGRSKKVNPGLHQGQQQVRSHSRKMNIQARAPIYHGIVDRLPQYANAVSDGVVDEWKGRSS